MAESTQIVFTHKEVVEALLKQQQIHDGIWGIYIKFGIKATNVGVTLSDLMPAAIIPVLEIGLQRFDEESNLAVNAATVNRKAASGAKKAAKPRKPVPRD